MENSNKHNNLVKSSKVIKIIKKVDFSLFPLNLTIRKITIYDDFDKINVKNKQVEIKLHKK